MKRIIRSLLLVVFLSSFVFAGTSSTTSTEFNIVEPSVGEADEDVLVVGKSSGSSDSNLKGVGVLILILLILVVVKKLFNSSWFSMGPSKKKTTRKRKVVKKSKRKKK